MDWQSKIYMYNEIYKEKEWKSDSYRYGRYSKKVWCI